MNGITGAMSMRVLRGLSFLLPAVFVALAVPVGFGQAAKVPDWQTAAGGKMSFEVASIRLSKPGTFTPPNFALNAEDGFVPTGGIFSADFPLEVYRRAMCFRRIAMEQC
jgi:hypothetical protein